MLYVQEFIDREMCHLDAIEAEAEAEQDAIDSALDAQFALDFGEE